MRLMTLSEFVAACRLAFGRLMKEAAAVKRRKEQISEALGWNWCLVRETITITVVNIIIVRLVLVLFALPPSGVFSFVFS